MCRGAQGTQCSCDHPSPLWLGSTGSCSVLVSAVLRFGLKLHVSLPPCLLGGPSWLGVYFYPHLMDWAGM